MVTGSWSASFRVDLAVSIAPPIDTDQAWHIVTVPNYATNRRKSETICRCGACFSLGANLPFDKLRANEKAYPFALSLSKGRFSQLEIRLPVRGPGLCVLAAHSLWFASGAVLIVHTENCGIMTYVRAYPNNLVNAPQCRPVTVIRIGS
jgi:hypothetical protein